MPSVNNSFSHAPIITTERLRAEPLEEVFAIRPAWARGLTIVYDDPDEQTLDNAICLVSVGKTHSEVIQLRAHELAVLCELSRFGGGVVTNSNHGKPVPQIYAKFSFPGASEDLMSIRRILFGAAPGKITKALWTPNDYRAESTWTENHRHPEKDARAKSIEHAKRLAHEADTNGAVFDIAAYLHNINCLFAEIDSRLGEEALGRYNASDKVKSA